MRVLFATNCGANYMAPPRLGDEQVNCGPDWPDAVAPDGRVLSLHTASGEYDLAAIAAHLPAEQQPDLVVCVTDATRRTRPRNLGAFPCPRVLLVADTHHQNQPVVGMLQYLVGEPWDRVVLLYDRHHAGIFRTAGVENLFWFPGLTFPHEDDLVKAARRPAAEREAAVAFVGQSGKFHPRRNHLLESMRQAGVPVKSGPGSQRDALAAYGRSSIGFNASLNGDLNLRVFEVLSAGAALLTDWLAPASGLQQLFPAGTIATYASGAELPERARDLLADPARTAAMGAAGAAWFDQHLGAEVRRAAFRALAFDGVEVPAFALPERERTQVWFGGDTDRLLQSAVIYEALQELHLENEVVPVFIEPGTPADVRELCETLPRVIVFDDPVRQCALGIWSGAHAEQAVASHTHSLWFWDTTPAEIEALAARLQPLGWIHSSDQTALFMRAAERSRQAAALATQARALLQQGRHPEAIALARAALDGDPENVDAYLVLGEVAMAHRQTALAEEMIRRAIELRPDDPALQRFLHRG